MQQSCRRRSRGGEGEVVPRGQAVAHFSFAVGVCSFRFFMERKRAREREMEIEGRARQTL